VTHGYAAQTAGQIIRLTDAHKGFGITGSGVVAVIDTGVDVNHPVSFRCCCLAMTLPATSRELPNGWIGL